VHLGLQLALVENCFSGGLFMKKIKKLRAKQICVPTLGRVILGQALVGLTETSPPHQIPEGLSSTPPEKCRPAYVEPVPTWGPLLLATRRATCTVAKAVTPFHSKKSLKIKTEERARERKETPLPLSLLLSLSRETPRRHVLAAFVR
jgi:hypothetical protein